MHACVAGRCVSISYARSKSPTHRFDPVFSPPQQAALAAAVSGFKEAALGDPALLNEFEERLRKVAEERFTAARTKLRAASEAAAQALLAAEGVKLRAIVDAPGSTLDEVEAELVRFLSDYDTRVQGPYKYKRATEFVVGGVIGAAREVCRRVAGERDDARRRAADADKRAAKVRPGFVAVR